MNSIDYLSPLRKCDFNEDFVWFQAVMDCVVNPPQPGEPSYELFSKEKAAVLKSLSERASTIAKAFNSIPGIKCNTVQGAMYAFPEVRASAF